MRYMFVVAHPDDEVLGAGAFLYSISQSDGEDTACIVILNADYEKTRKEMFTDIEKSHEILSITDHALFSYKNMNFMNENHREMVECIEDEIRRYKPDVIFTHFDGDLHNDHRVTSICTQQAARLYQRHGAGHKVAALYEMEILSSTGWSNHSFRPDTYIMASEQSVSKKIQALGVYKNVVRPIPHPRSEECIRALAIVRGSEIGYHYAEAFKTVWRDGV